MEGSKTKIIIASAIIIIIVIASIGIYLMGGGAGGITAMEGREIADDLASTWNSSAILVNVMGMGSKHSDGTCSEWGYSYSSNYPDINISKGYLVTVYADSSYITGEVEHPPSPQSLQNWSVDSTEATSIAKSNSEVSEFLSNYPNAKIERIVFVGNNIRSNGCLMNIQWSYNAWIDEPHNIRVWIDATNGEIVDIE